MPRRETGPKDPCARTPCAQTPARGAPQRAVPDEAPAETPVDVERRHAGTGSPPVRVVRLVRR